MTRAVFIASKDPSAGLHDGDTQVTGRLLQAAAATCSVGVIALAEQLGVRTDDWSTTRVPKPPLRPARLAASSVTRRRSLIHTRFAPRSLIRALETEAADVLVARRVYMAQAALDAGRVPPRDRLVVLVDVLESTVLQLRRSRVRPLLSLESRRTRRDERRCIEAASDVACLSDTELHEVGVLGGPPARRLDLLLAPAAGPSALEEPIAVFVGDRRWPPNAEALSALLDLWPRIARSAPPSARLLVVGRPGPGERAGAHPGVEVLGFVDDLTEIWRIAAVLLAPVRIGGGVRVKILDAARHGVPVVGSPAAVGSTGSYLPLEPCCSDEQFVAEAASLLAGTERRRERGEALFEANRALHERGFLEEQMAGLLVASSAGSA